MAVVLKAERKVLDQPDEKRTFPNGHFDVVRIAGMTIGRMTLEPGWHWAEHVKPQVGTDSCMVPHGIYVISGRLRSRLNSGEEFDLGPGEAGYVPPGHDGWVVGKEPVVLIEMLGAAEYGRRK
jgi:quercetin dioxygenase-like cupin family protein